MTQDGPARILVVDDTPANLYGTSRVLSAHGFNVLQAETGQQALELAAQRPDLIILDVNLPDLSGFEVCRRLRRDERTARIAVIHLSASFTNDLAKVQGLEGGADGYLTRPVEPPVLIATVRAFLRARKAEDALRASEEKFRAVFDQALNGIALINEKQTLIDANPALCALLGDARDALLNRPLADFLPAERREEIRSVIAQVERSGAWRGVCPIINLQGRRISLDWSVSRHSVPGVRLAVVSDISERLQAEEHRAALLRSERIARSEAEQANRVKDDFLATLSHELRTPLSAVVGWAQLLLHRQDINPEVKDGLDTILRNAQAQTRLISDLLDVSGITSGKVRLELQPIDLVALIETAAASAKPSAAAKRIRILTEIRERQAIVSADSARLQQVVANLLTNAVKFTPAGGSIHVGLQRVGEQVEFEVVDSGIGMQPEMLSLAFERFRQAATSTTRQTGGLGLGLAIAKHLVEMHGGTISAFSEGTGKGARFTVRLPLADPKLQRKPAETPEHAEPIAAGENQNPDLRGIRVLVVDDEPDVRTLLVRMLRDCNAETLGVDGAAAALDALDRYQPHVLVSDIGMPERDGYELMRSIRARGFTEQQLPAIALTAFAHASDRDRAVTAGYQVHLAKPVNLGQLAGIIGAVANRGKRAISD